MSAQTESTLHLPRILCLHGGGVNSAIFRLQARGIMKQLRNNFRFCFAEAPYVSEPTADIARAFKGMGPYKTWLRWQESDEERSHSEGLQRIDAAIQAAIDEDNREGADGEWVGLMGFSQGGKLCASILATQQHRNAGKGGSGWPSYPDFKFGIFLAGRGPLVWMDRDENAIPTAMVDSSELSTIDVDNLPAIAAADKIHAPTLHVHGLQDPGIEIQRKLLDRCCDPNSTRVLEWQGKHTVPMKSPDVTRVVQEILLLAKKAGVSAYR